MIKQGDCLELMKEIPDGSVDALVRRDFSARLRQARKESGLTQAQLAEQIGMTQGGYTQYENAGREPSLSTLAKLSRILKRPTDWLLGLAISNVTECGESASGDKVRHFSA